jgi:hypothetical protein
VLDFSSRHHANGSRDAVSPPGSDMALYSGYPPPDGVVYCRSDWAKSTAKSSGEGTSTGFSFGCAGYGPTCYGPTC